MRRTEPTRRTVLHASLASAVLAWIGQSSRAHGSAPRAPRAIPFGLAISPEAIQTDAAYARAILAHADFVVPEWGMKWGDLRPTREAFHTTFTDRVADFAQRNRLPLRGHTLIWNEVNPPWVAKLGSRASAERELTLHITRLMAHLRGSVRSWDVVNEPTADKPTANAPYRRGPWLDLIGPDYIALALTTARKADPLAELIVNEFGIEHATPEDTAKRDAFRALVRRLLDRGVPLDGIGLQAHLDGARPINADAVSRLVAEFRSWGLKVLVTELDVNDKALPADIATRDARVAEHVRTFLNAVVAGGRPQSIATWGFSDRYTWMPTWHKRADGLLNRPLPFDRDYQPKPFYAVLEGFTRPAR
jgi:endo-1,4-beta-xylanase